jgi:hypothetical protein
MTSESSETPTRFYFVTGWPSTMATYTSPVRAHVLRKHNTLRRSRRKGTQQKRLPPESTTDKDISSQCPVNGNDDDMTLIDGTNPPRTTLTFFQQGTADPFQAFARSITNFERLLIERCMVTVSLAT